MCSSDLRDAKSATAKISLDVQDDFAAMTTLTGTVSRDGTWFAWLRNRATGVTLKMKAGETVRISEIAAEITEITARYVRLKDAAGIWKLALGGALRDRVLETPAEPQPVAVEAVPSAEGAAPATAPESPAAAPGATPETPAPVPTEAPAPEVPPAEPAPAEPAPATPPTPGPGAEPAPQPAAEPQPASEPTPASEPAPAAPATGAAVIN